MISHLLQCQENKYSRQRGLPFVALMASSGGEHTFYARLIAEGVSDLLGFLQASVGSCSSRDLPTLAMVPLSPLLPASRVVCWGQLAPNPPCPKPPFHLRRSSSLPHPEQAASGWDFGGGSCLMCPLGVWDGAAAGVNQRTQEDNSHHMFLAMSSGPWPSKSQGLVFLWGLTAIGTGHGSKVL